MARLNSRGCDNASQMSPDISDDEVFDSQRVWRPLSRTNGPALGVGVVATQTTHVELSAEQNFSETQKCTSSSTASGQSNCGSQSQSVCDSDDRLWSRSSSSYVQNFLPHSYRSDSSQTIVKSESSQRAADAAGSTTENVSSCSFRELHRRKQMQFDRQQSIVDGLLFEIYDRWHGRRADSFDSDTFTECSSTSDAFHGRWDSSYETAGEQRNEQLTRSFLETQSTTQLRRVVYDLQRGINQASGRLVRQLKRRDRHLARLARHSDVVTAVLQAASLKRQIDTRMKFSVTPAPGQTAFDQWKDAMKAVNRLPMGLPPEFRKKVWLSLADHYIRKLKIDWHKTVRLAFNERSNPDDDKLGMQIVKDLHRTGCSSFSGQDNEEDRAVLKRVLLAYARWNKRIGYCQGFNVIAALLLNVMERKEDDALKVMIYLIDHVLPESYFDNNLRALSVDMAVFRDLLRLTLPTLSRHLDRLQHAAQDINTGACYEPPLTNVFTMQWFLTLFATCLPKDVVLRVWDAILLEGSEVLLRTALCLWGKLARRIMKVDSADEFYSLMGELSSHMMEGTVFNSDDMIKAIYAIAPFPFPQLTELREKYTYNIRPFSSTNPMAGGGKGGGGSGGSGSGGGGGRSKVSRMAKAVLYSDEDDLDEEDMRALTSFPGMGPPPQGRGKGTDISVVGPGAYGAESELVTGGRDSMYMERMSTDISALKMQYDKLRQRQRQAHVIISGAASAKKPVELKPKTQAPVLVPKIESPLAMNHLFVGKVQGGRNRLVTHGPRIAPTPTPATTNSTLTKQLQAVAAAQAASRSKRSSPSAQPTSTITITTPPSSSSSSPSHNPGQQDEDGYQANPPTEELRKGEVEEKEEEKEKRLLDYLSVGDCPAEKEDTEKGEEKEGGSETGRAIALAEEESLSQCQQMDGGGNNNIITMECGNCPQEESDGQEQAPARGLKGGEDAFLCSGLPPLPDFDTASSTAEDANAATNSASANTATTAAATTNGPDLLHHHPENGDSVGGKVFSLDPDPSQDEEPWQDHYQSTAAGLRDQEDSGVSVSSPPSPDSSCQTSPVKKAVRPVSIQLWTYDDNDGRTYSNDALQQQQQQQGGYEYYTDSNRSSSKPPPQIRMGRCNSAPIGSSSGHMTMLSAALAPTATLTPTHMQRGISLSAACTPTTTTTVAMLPHSPSHPPSHQGPLLNSSSSSSSLPLSSSSSLSSPMKSMRPFNPFPVKHVNTNRARTGLKLGLYTPSTLEHIQGQLLGGLVPRKARNASS